MRPLWFIPIGALVLVSICCVSVPEKKDDRVSREPVLKPKVPYLCMVDTGALRCIPYEQYLNWQAEQDAKSADPRLSL